MNREAIGETAGDTLRRYRTYAGLLWRSSRKWSLIAGTVAVASGFMPVVIILASGALVGSLPDTVRDGVSSTAGGRTVWMLTAFIAGLLASAALEMLQQVVSQILTARYLVTVHDIVAAASLDPEQIDHLEDPQTARHFGAVTEALREGGFLFGVNSTISVVSMRLSSLGSAAVLLAFRWWAPLLLLAGWFVVSRAYNKWMATAFDELVEVTGSDRRRAEYLRGLMMGAPAAKEVRIFGLSHYLGHRFASTWLTAMETVWRHRRHSFGPLGVALAVMLATNAIVFTVLGRAAYDGTLSLGQLAIFVLAIPGVQDASVLGDPQTQLGRAITLARHVQHIADRWAGRPAIARPAGPPSGSGAAGIDLHDVSFTYQSRQSPTLRRFSLSIPAGQSVAIVGENGAGKSTLIKLLCGLYVPDEGQVRLDGVDLADADSAMMRRRLAVIFQDFVRYHLPLRENVGFGGPANIRDTARLQGALAHAGGLALLDRLEFGWETVLSAEYDGGTDLSGGQWQRVALARALAALDGGAGVLILDEPTAALDVRAEAELFDRFLQVTRGATTILVSHRLSSVRHADRIVVLADGAVIEDGTHEDLLALGGRYATMFALQAQRFTRSGSVDVEESTDA